jgi:hypothetical protein
MPAERVPTLRLRSGQVRSVREILRLKAEGLSDRAIARSTRLARAGPIKDGRAIAGRGRGDRRRLSAGAKCTASGVESSFGHWTSRVHHVVGGDPR